VGGDWWTYMIYLDVVQDMGFFEVITQSDPSYYLINWLSVKVGLGIVGVNIVGGGILVYGLLRICSQQPLPWLGVLVSVPYLLTVVGMGYSRQAMALGFVLLAFANWPQKKFFSYCIFILIATTFHKSAIILMPFAIFINKRFLREKLFLGIPLMLFLLWYLIYSFFWSTIFFMYFRDASYDSKGALIRVIMNLIPTIILFSYSDKFKKFGDYNLWRLIGIAVFFSCITVFPFSTVTDRISLFFSPLQIVVYSRISAISRDKEELTLFVIAILFVYAMAFFVWLNYAIHSSLWLPYLTVFSS
jgi:hypothetical protein